MIDHLQPGRRAAATRLITNSRYSLHEIEAALRGKASSAASHP